MEDFDKECILRIMKFRNSDFKIKDERIDLHGLTYEEAKLVLDVRIG
jgi:DNA-nicking Smr family endonuclease